jgi:hypothetical protein
MKIRLVIVALFLVGLVSACTQRTCPTYAKGDTQIEKAEKVRV